MVSAPYILINFVVALVTFVFINRGVSFPAASRLRIIFVALIAFAIDFTFAMSSTFMVRFVGASFAYFALDTLLMIKYQEKPKHVFLIGTATIQLIYFVAAHNIPATSVPLIFTPALGFVFAFLGIRVWGRWWRFSALVFVLSVITVIGYPNYYSFFLGEKQNRFDNRSALSLVDRNGDTLRLSDVQSKIIVLDFWNTGCAICFREFPDFENFAKQFDKEEVFFATVFVPNNEKQQASDNWYYYVNEYATNHYRTLDHLNSTDEWRIPGYPWILIFDHRRKLRYEGALNKNRFIHNPKLIVKSLLREAVSTEKEIATSTSVLQN